MGNPGNAGIGGVFRDHEGKFVAAFARNIGSARNNKAETWALLRGVQLAIDLDIKKLLIESDSSFLFYCLCRQEDHPNTQTLLVETKLLLQKCEQVKFKFGYRECNKVADWLAKKGADMKTSEEWVFYFEPLWLKKIVHQDLVSSWSRCTSKLCTNSIDLVA